MPTFRKKPVEIEAMQYDGSAEVGQAIARWGNEDDPVGGVPISFITPDGHGSLCIETLEGTMMASPGDWIIRGVKGELYPCKPDIFEATYEPVDSLIHGQPIEVVDGAWPTGPITCAQCGTQRGGNWYGIPRTDGAGVMLCSDECKAAWAQAHPVPA
jgi:hypothetical protein